MLLLTDQAAAQIDTLSVIGASGAPGSRGHIVQIALMNAEPLAGLQLTLTANPDALVIDSVRTTPRTDGFTVHWNGDTGKMLLIDMTGRRTIETGFGPVLEVFYTVKPTAKPGAVALSPQDVILADPNAKAVPAATAGGIFVVEQDSAKDTQKKSGVPHF